MTRPPDLSRLTEARKDALLVALWERVQEQALAIGERDAVLTDLAKRVADLEAELGRPPKGPGKSLVPPSQGQEANDPSGKAGHAKQRRRGTAGAGAGWTAPKTLAAHRFSLAPTF